MSTAGRRIRPLPGIAIGCWATACGGVDRGPSWVGSVDTLPGGAVVVRSPAEGIWTADTAWRLREDLRIGAIDSEGPAAFGAIAGIAIDPTGRIYVLDRQAKDVRVFDGAGTHVRTIGREGGGPGEFGDPIALALAPDRSLLVVDVGNGRYSKFDTAGAYVGATRREVGGYSVPAQVVFDAGGRFHEGALTSLGDRFGPAVLRFAADLSRFEVFPTPELRSDEYELIRGDFRMTADVPFAPRLVWALDPRGRYWTAVTDRMRFVEHGIEGDTLRVIQREFEPTTTTDADREQALEDLTWFTRQGGTVDPARIPDIRPQFHRFVVAPDGHVWVLVTRHPPETPPRFDVYGPDGRYLGAVETDLAISPAPVFVGDRVYGVTSDRLGVTYVVRAAIERGR